MLLLLLLRLRLRLLVLFPFLTPQTHEHTPRTPRCVMIAIVGVFVRSLRVVIRRLRLSVALVPMAPSGPSGPSAPSAPFAPTRADSRFLESHQSITTPPQVP